MNIEDLLWFVILAHGNWKNSNEIDFLLKERKP